MSTREDDFLRRLEEHRGDIESWLRRDHVPAVEVPEMARAVILHAYEKREAYDPAQPLEPWLRTLTKRAAQQYHRTMKTRAALAYLLMEEEEAEPTPERDFIERELFGILSGAVAELDPETRHVLEAHYWQGKKLEDISEELGIPVRTLKRRLAEARAALHAAVASRGITDTRRAGLLLPFALVRVLYQGGPGEDAHEEGDGQETRSPGSPGADPVLAPPQVPQPPSCVPAKELPATGGALLGSHAARSHAADAPPPGPLVRDVPELGSAPPGAPQTRTPRERKLTWQGVTVGVAIGLMLLPLSTCDRAQSHGPIEVKVGFGGPLHYAALATGCRNACTAPAPTLAPVPGAAGPTRDELAPTAKSGPAPRSEPGARPPAEDEGERDIVMEAENQANAKGYAAGHQFQAQ